MKEKLAGWLACPNCSGNLKLTAFNTVKDDKTQTPDIEDGILACACGSVYPIHDGVPRMLEGALAASTEFVERWMRELAAAGALTDAALRPPSKEFTNLIEPTLKRFEKEWSEHEIEETTWGFDQKTRLEHTLRYLGWTPDEIKGKLVLDAGAGTGQLTCSIATLGCEVVGVDLQPAVARGWHSREKYAGDRKDYVHFVQGNLMKPPFRRETFDGVVSSGVLHHTPDTRQAFDAVAPLVKKGGSFGVWLYKVCDDKLMPLVPFVTSSLTTLNAQTLRKFTTKMPPGALYVSLWTYASVFQVFYKLNAVLRGRKHEQTVKERTTSLFDTLAPPYVWKHTPEEVFEWFRTLGYRNVRDTSLPDDDYGFCVTGTRGE